jgi:hypothetical protein
MQIEEEPEIIPTPDIKKIEGGSHIWGACKACWFRLLSCIIHPLSREERCEYLAAKIYDLIKETPLAFTEEELGVFGCTSEAVQMRLFSNMKLRDKINAIRHEIKLGQYEHAYDEKTSSVFVRIKEANQK